MTLPILFGILLPFIGTTLGAMSVFMPRKALLHLSGIHLFGFAAGVMMAASVWSLILPSVELSKSLGFFSFFPALSGIWLGALFLCLCNIAVKKLSQCKHVSSRLLFYLAVVLHNIPEGMAVGIAFSGLFLGKTALFIPALMLSLGIALQNIPEGAIISIPLTDERRSRKSAFFLGSMSGIVEPIAAFFTLFASPFITYLLPYLLGFAAGAMIFVTITDLLPETDGNSLFFLIGFSVMMVLDVALG